MSREDEDKKATSDDEDRALDLRITEYLKLGVPAATIACAAAAGFVQGASAVVLVLAGGALVGAIAIFWSSVRTLVGETPLSGADAYAIGAPRAEEEQKRAVLRALKDLEFERSVGKISEEDYQALVTKYRAEAKRLLRVLDEGAEPQRAKVEALVQKRLAREGLQGAPPAVKDDDGEEPREAKPSRDEAASGLKPRAPKEPTKQKASIEIEPLAEPKAEAPKVVEEAAACAKCGTKNDADAVFCKKCGARQSAEEEPESESDSERKEASA